MEKQKAVSLRQSALAAIVLSALLTACGGHPQNENSLGSIGGDGLQADSATSSSTTGMGTATASVNGARGSYGTAEQGVNAVRSAMLAELEAVRARLNVGDAPAWQHREDTKRAAELAIGLERVDRTDRLLAATENGWPAGRDTVQEAVADLHAWWKAHQREDVVALTED